MSEHKRYCRDCHYCMKQLSVVDEANYKKRGIDIASAGFICAATVTYSPGPDSFYQPGDDIADGHVACRTRNENNDCPHYLSHYQHKQNERQKYEESRVKA